MNTMPLFTSAPPSRRPSWAAKKPDLELDYRTLDARGEPIIKSILDAADLLHPGKVLSVRIDFEPSLLYHLLHRKGCEHWHESVEAGDRNVYFCKRRRV